MNKVSSSLILTGLGLLFIAFLVCGLNFGNIITVFNESAGYETKTLEVDPSALTDTVFDISNSNIKVVPTDSDKIKISYYETKYLKYNHHTDGNTFYFQKEKTNILHIGFDLFFTYDRIVTIEIPKTSVIAVDISNSNGGMEIRDLALTSAIFETSNGLITLTGTESKGDIRLRSSNGRLTLDQVLASGLIDMKTSNGSIELDNVETVDIEGRSSNGKVSFTNLVASDVKFGTSNGSIDGSIKGLNDDYAKRLTTSNGRIRVDDGYVGNNYHENTNDTKNVELSTSNGSITLLFTK